ncbi:hypothetical protein QMT40_000144 [Parvibaculaceae bacterium PLY_AMNH_Bact1]|nr:hypothetical protein QMT40_000144 [Parvibaculaceae bacterium PLY_AMNH_Bact1]
MTCTIRSVRRSGCVIAAAVMMSFLAPAGAGAEENGLVEALVGGKPIADIRLRYEHVDQAGLLNNADAITARARLGYETGVYADFSLLVEGEFIIGLGSEDYNDTINGRATFPVVADPEDQQLNRAQVTYSGISDTTVIIGRQRVILDNARFVGNVGWRQNEQTFDAAVVATTFIPDTTLIYGYVDQINRIFGTDSAVGRLDTNTHLINAKFNGIENIEIGTYAYLLDVDRVPAASTATYGVRASGKFDVAEDVVLGLSGEYARQSDRANNPRNVSLDYYRTEASLGYQGVTGLVGYEVLEGDGTVGFGTPLATLHAFQGWADVFLATPAGGIEDLYIKGAYNAGAVLGLAGLSGAVIYHDFEGERTGGDLGTEWDAVLKAKIDDHFSVVAKYATYDGPTGGPVDRDKVWFQVGYKY